VRKKGGTLVAGSGRRNENWAGGGYLLGRETKNQGRQTPAGTRWCAGTCCRQGDTATEKRGGGGKSGNRRGGGKRWRSSNSLLPPLNPLGQKKNNWGEGSKRSTCLIRESGGKKSCGSGISKGRGKTNPPLKKRKMGVASKGGIP